MTPDLKNSLNGLSTSQRKIDREPDEIVRMLQPLPNANFFCKISARSAPGLVEKLLKLDRSVADRFYALYREQHDPVPGDKLMGETRDRTGTKLGSIGATFGRGD
jgi:hypothetical protein